MRIESENVDVDDIFKFQVIIIKSGTQTIHACVTTSQSGDHDSEGETVSLALVAKGASYTPMQATRDFVGFRTF